MANSTAERQIVSLKIVHTSDVHGTFFMRDYVNNHAVRGSLSRVYAYVQSLRKAYGDRLLLMDGGDILQGSPVVYYSNFVASSGKNLAAEIMNYMAYDVGVMGNHDIETGHAVYDRLPFSGAGGQCDRPGEGRMLLASLLHIGALRCESSRNGDDYPGCAELASAGFVGRPGV